MSNAEHRAALRAGLREYPPNRIVKDPFGETGWAESDPYGDDEHARAAFIKGWKARAAQMPSAGLIVETVLAGDGGRDELVAVVAELLRPKAP